MDTITGLPGMALSMEAIRIEVREEAAWLWFVGPLNGIQRRGSADTRDEAWGEVMAVLSHHAES